MEEKKKQELKQFLEMSRKMLDSAKNNDWEELPALESERKKLMVSFFESDVSAENSKDDQLKIEQSINEVLSINEEIDQLAQKEKVTISQQLHGFKKKQNVHSAYLQNK